MKTLFIGQQVIRLAEIASTNSYATALLRKENLPEGTIVLAEKQMQGRGYRGRTWLSEPGKNLTFSVILYPKFLEPDAQFLLSMAIALAVADCVSEITGKQASVKWPNDIYITEKKISGLLIENTINSKHIVHSVVGIGLNVNQNSFDSSLPNPTSVALETGKNCSIEDCFCLLCGKVEARYLQLKSASDTISHEYEKKLYKKGHWSALMWQNEEIEAQIKGVSERGELLLETRAGKKISCAFHEVEFRN